MPQKPSIPKGTRDFSPTEVAKRNYIINTIKKHFEVYGFQPIETPSFENSETLMGKYGDEGDRLIFKILESGDYLYESSFRGRYLNYLLGNSAVVIEFIEVLKEVFSNLNKWMIEKEEVDSRKFNIQKIENLPIFKEGLNDELISQFNNQVLQSFLVSIELQEYEQTIEYEKILDEFLDFFQTLVNIGSLEEYIENDNKFYWERIYGFSAHIFEKYFDKQISSIDPSHANITKRISGKALRYDLTVPFARYVVMHQNEIDFPFKRYQVQPVWRADRPQKGRFREFYQCDADVVGANSLLQEVEFVQLYDAVFTDLGLKGTTIKLNNRKVLSGIAEVIGAKHSLIDFTVALDKLDKIGEEKVKEEMMAKGISEAAVEKALPLFAMSGSATGQLNQLRSLLETSEIGMQGVVELEEIVNMVEAIGLQSATLQLDVTLARGLNYYTGAIYEVSAPEGVKMGSIGGGGRYDDLTGIFGLKGVSGVGISFGLDRIYLVLEELGLFPETLDKSIDVLCINFGKAESLASLKLVGQLRNHGIKAEVYPTATKMQKQMKYANNRNVPYVVMIGDQELSKGEFVVKNMVNGEQQTYALDKLEEFCDSI